ncbi:unknown [Bacteroides sp. CAG:1060]|nr:unknown [Bacteroides sp. CAG:1060]
MSVQFEARDALLPILLDDGIVGCEFHRIAKGITDGPADHAAEDLILGTRSKFRVLAHDLVCKQGQHKTILIVLVLKREFKSALGAADGVDGFHIHILLMVYGTNINRGCTIA